MKSLEKMNIKNLILKNLSETVYGEFDRGKIGRKKQENKSGESRVNAKKNFNFQIFIV
jgi:hypothetical protein